MFDELIFKKGLCLVRGDIIGDLTKNDSETIFNMTKDFFTKESLYNKVTTFNRDPNKFNIDDHITLSLNYFNKV
jgi:hypothetical protein